MRIRSWLACVGILSSVVLACSGESEDLESGAEGAQTEADDLFTLTKLPELRIALDGAAVGALTATPRTSVAATMTHAGRTFAIDVKLKGSASFRPLGDKPSFKIHVTGTEKLTGLTHFTLNNMVQDVSMVHEVMGYRYYAALGLKAPRAGYAKVFVNGEYKGLYSNIESFEKPLVERTFGSAKGTLFEGTIGADFESSLLPKFDLKFGEEADRAKLGRIADAVAAPGDGVLFEKALVDTPQFLSLMASDTLLANWDGYRTTRNNYYVYCEGAKPCTFMPSGIDNTFGSFDSGRELGREIYAFDGVGLLFEKCMGSRRCADQYAQALGAAVSAFRGAGLEAILDQARALIADAAKTDAKKPYTNDQVRAAQERARAYIRALPGELDACVQSGKVVSRCDRVLRFDHGTDRRFAGPDWSPNRFKAECAPLGAIAGLSTTPGTNEVRAALCTASDATRFGSTRSACTARSFAAGDARGTSSSGDWAPGYLKGECADGEYVAGVSQSPDRKLDAILCCPRVGARTASHPLAAAGHDVLEGARIDDWDRNHYKAECAADGYVCGVSRGASDGHLQSVLCCR